MEEAGVVQPNRMFIDSPSAQKRVVETGPGLGFLSYSSVRDELAEGMLVLVDVPKVSTQTPVSLIHRRMGYLSPAARELKARLVDLWEKT